MITMLGTIGAVAATALALAECWRRFVRPMWRMITKAGELIDVLCSVDDRLTVLEDRSRQLSHNGGSHMRDDVTKIKTLVEAHISWANTEHAGTIAEMGEMWEALRHGYLSTGGSEAAAGEQDTEQDHTDSGNSAHGGQ